MLVLKAEKRESGERIDKNREIPAVVYGPHIKENHLIKVKYSDFLNVYDEAGTSSIINLEFDGEQHDVLVKDFQIDPVSDNFIHVDFYAVTKGEELEVEVELEFTGKAPALDKGLIVNNVLNKIKIKTLPSKIPAKIEVDLGNLKEEGDSIRVEDLSIPEGVTVLENLDEVVAVVHAPEVEENAEESEKTEGEG